MIPNALQLSHPFRLLLKIPERKIFVADYR